MLLDSEPIPVSNNIAIRIPDRNAPFQPSLSDTNSTGSGANQPSSGQVTPAAGASAVPGGDSATTATPAPAAPVQASPPAPVAAAPLITKPEPKPEPKPESKSKQEPKPESKSDASKSAQSNANRSDDGARALALLEGRPTESNTANNAGATKQPTKGNFVVQALSLDAAADAQTQRDKLSASGISNAFVDGPVVVNGMKKYRVRVGPFPSREAAQAAQTRLRTLGFGGAFITAQ
jgi:DedD protein